MDTFNLHFLNKETNMPFLPKEEWMFKVKGQGQIFQKWVKNQRTDHISEAISPTDFIFGIKVQPNKAHSMTQVHVPLIELTNFHRLTKIFLHTLCTDTTKKKKRWRNDSELAEKGNWS